MVVSPRARLLVSVVAVLASTWASLDVFSAGEAGFYCIKIPSLTVTNNGTLLATGEGRYDNCLDFTTTHLVFKRSTDRGRSWSNLQILHGEANGTWIGNAAPVVLSETGRILVVFCRNNTDVLLTYSDDDGASFAAPRLLTGVTNSSWTWVGTGPPASPRLRSGRIIVPSYHSFTPGDDGEVSSGHVMFSDDLGASWGVSDPWSDGLNFPNEAQAVELPDGSVFIHARGLLASRVGALSVDGAQTWKWVGTIPGLYQPVGGCEGSTIMLPGGQTVLYSGLAETSLYRYNLSFWLAHAGNSSTNGPTGWAPVAVIDANPSAYSAVALLPAANDTTLYPPQVGLLYERSNKTLIIFVPDAIAFAAFPVPTGQPDATVDMNE